MLGSGLGLGLRLVLVVRVPCSSHPAAVSPHPAPRIIPVPDILLAYLVVLNHIRTYTRNVRTIHIFNSYPVNMCFTYAIIPKALPRIGHILLLISSQHAIPLQRLVGCRISARRP